MCGLVQSIINKFNKDIDETKCTYALVGSKQSTIIKEILDKTNISIKDEMFIMTYIYELEDKVGENNE